MKKNLSIIAIFISFIFSFFFTNCSLSGSNTIDKTNNSENANKTYSIKGYVFKSTTKATTGNLIVLTQNTPPTGFEPASNARVSFKGNDYYTNSNGFFSIDNINYDDYVNTSISVYLNGYAPTTYTLPAYTNNSANITKIEVYPEYDNILTNSFGIYSIFAYDENGYFAFLNKDDINLSIDNNDLIKNLSILDFGEIYLETNTQTGTATITISLKNNPNIQATITLNITDTYSGGGSYNPPSNINYGYIYGYIYQDGTDNYLDNYMIKLVNTQDYSEYYSTLSYDGYYELSYIPYGTYQIYLLDSNYNELYYNENWYSNSLYIEDGQITINEDNDVFDLDIYVY